MLQEGAGIKIHRNGGLQGVKIVQQRVWNGHLALVADCAVCGSRYRYPELDDAEDLLTAIDHLADRYANSPFERERDETRAVFWRTIADRVRAGYATEVQ